MKLCWLFLLLLPLACRPSSQEEQWYQTLKKEKVAQEQSVMVTPAGGQAHPEKMIVLGRGQWIEAAREIVQPGENQKLRGEILRDKRNPSVTELLVNQANIVADQASHLDQFQGVDAINMGTELTGIISKWEKPAAVAPAQVLMRRAIVLWPNWTTFIMSSDHDLARDIPQLAEIRIEGADTNALDEYAAWIKTAEEEKIDEYAIEAFEPLWRNPTNPAVVTISEWLFNDTNSAWSKLPWQRSAFHDPLDSNLVTLPAFRQMLARELDDKSPFGSMQWQTGIGMNINYSVTGSSGGYQFDWPDAESPTNGMKVQIRYSDWIAWKLSKSKQIPFFNPFVPIEKRDEAIKNAKAELLKSK